MVIIIPPPGRTMMSHGMCDYETMKLNDPCLTFSLRICSVHQNYVGIDSEKQPYFLSIVSQDSGTKSMPLCRVILFRKQVSSLGAEEVNGEGSEDR